MASSKTRAARSKRTKDSLIDEMEALEAQQKSAVAVDPTSAAIARESAAKARSVAKSMTVDTIVKEGAEFRLSVQRTIDELTEQAVNRADELRILTEAREAEEAELERLYGLDVASASIKALVEEHSTKRAELEAEIETKRVAWDEERKAFDKATAQRNADVSSERTREQADYNYRTTQERSRAQEAFNYELQIAKRNNAETITKTQNEINARLAEVAAQEAAFVASKKRLEGLDEEIKNASNAAVAIATNSVKKDLTAQFALERQALTAEKMLLGQQNDSLNQANAKLAQEITKLYEQLNVAKEQVTSITIKALESASGQQSLQAVQALVKENGSSSRNGTKS